MFALLRRMRRCECCCGCCDGEGKRRRVKRPRIKVTEVPLDDEKEAEVKKEEEEEEDEESEEEERGKQFEGRMHPGINILVTGTPGTGKSTLCQLVASAVTEGGLLKKMDYIDLGKLVRERGLHDGYNEEYDCYMLNTDKVCDELEERMDEGGVILEAHSCDFFPERWFDLVVVLRTNNTILYDRLAARKYKKMKVEENVEAEIMQIVLDEVRNSYKEEITLVLTNDTMDQLDDNCQRVIAWITDWLKNHPEKK